MVRGNRFEVKGSGQRGIQHKEHDSEESDEVYRVTEDEDCDESDEFCSLDGDESEEIVADFRESRRVSLGKKVNGIVKPRKRRKVVYTEKDADDDEEIGQVADEDDAEFMPLGGESNQIKKPKEKKRVSDTEVDDGGDGDEPDSKRKRNQRKRPREKKKRVVYTDESEGEDDGYDDNDNEFKSLGKRKVNQKKNPTAKKKVSYTKDDDEGEDDYAGFVSSDIKRNQRRKNLVYTDDDDDDDDDVNDSECMYPSKKGNQKAFREKRTGSYKEGKQEEEDENDAEFKLSESDFVDDEDETPKLKKTDKVSRPRPQKKSARGEQKKCKKSKLKNRNKKVSKRRKQKERAESDSDFVNSASSDHEYTISEEEREQMREARVYCANLRDKLRRSSCGNQEKPPAYEQSKYPIRKGKEKTANTKDEVGNEVCGICLSEERKRTVRGVLNCCQHHFCFSCIMEWSKVESRCPLCKQRFATITKSAKSDTGLDSRTVVIPVPKRDQVYEPSEEELRGYLDPYESVICTECHNGGDDALMLLCDMCDSSAHTFCVGLGREVPEGNWYCEGCRPTIVGTLNASDLSSPIGVGFDLNELYVPETPLTQETRVLPEPMPAPVGAVGATTLRDRRRIHRHIHHRILNNNNRTDDLVGRSSGTLASSSGVRLFGSRLDLNDHMFPSQNSDLASVDVSLQDQHGGLGIGTGMGFDSRLGYAQLHPCTNRSSMMVDACREVIVPSGTSQGGLHTPY